MVASRPERRDRHNPEAILTMIGLQAGMTFVDVGCGTGFFALPAARIIGKSGRVYGIDLYPELIENLREIAAIEGLDNMELMTGNAPRLWSVSDVLILSSIHG